MLTARSQLRGNLELYEIKELTTDAAVQVLTKWAEPNQQTVLDHLELARSLCDRLGCLPLAITLVGSWLSETERTLPMAIAALEEQGLASAVLEPERDDTRQKAELGLRAAFAMSWQPLTEDARQLGRVLSLFEPIDLPWELVESAVKAYPQRSAAPPVRKGWWQRFWDSLGQLVGLLLPFLRKSAVLMDAPFVSIRNLREARIVLRKMSLLQSVEQGKTYRLHRLVHEFFALQWEGADRDGWQEAWLRGLSDRADEIPAFASWELVTAWQPLRPHFLSAQKFIEARLKSANNPALVGIYKLPRNNLTGGIFRLSQAPIFEATYRQAISTHDRAKAALKVGDTAAAQSYFDEAIKGYQRAIEQAKVALPENSMILAGYLHQIAVLFYELGNYSAGIPPAEEAVKIADIKASPLTLALYLAYLAILYKDQGKYSEAEPLYLRSLEIYERQLGADHPDVATNLNNLAALYRAQGKYSEAEPLYLRSLEIRERQLGEDHPNVAQSLNNLALLYDSQGKYSEAEPLYLRSLSILERQLGADHPDVATNLNNLALLYDNQGKYREAEPLYLRSLEIKERQLGADHPNVATSLNNLAYLYKSQGKYSEAEPLYLRSLEIRERQLGADHPNVAQSLFNLAALYHNTQRHPEALQSIQRAIQIYEQKLGTEHPTTQNALGWLQTIRDAV